MNDDEIRARIAQSIDIDAVTGCWMWTGARSSTGYGSARINGRQRNMHRVSYEAFARPIPPGLHIDHLCRVRACINPEHLEPVTQAENNRRSSLSSHWRCGHEITPASTYVRPDTGHRTCRICARRRSLARYDVFRNDCDYKERLRARAWYYQHKGTAA